MRKTSIAFSAGIFLGLQLLWACTSPGSGNAPGAGGSRTGGSAPVGGTTSGGTTGHTESRSTGGDTGPRTAGTGGSTSSSSGGGRATGGSSGSGGASTSSGGASGGAGGTGGGANPSGGVQNLGGSVSNGGTTTGRGGSNAGGSSATGGSGGSAPDASTADAAANRDSSASGPDPFVSGQPPAAAAHFKKGINLGNRLEAPNEGDWGGKVLASDFPFIAKRGFDHVRIPIRFSGHAASSAPYTIDASFFSRIDTVLDQATAANLAVLVDMHAYDEMATNPSGERTRFVALWSQIASRYEDRPDTIAFELLNEPYKQLDTTWNDIAAAAITAIRATNPRRLLVVDTVNWADPAKLSSLTLPNDANIMVAVHMYEPKLFGFQGMSWMGAEFMTTGVVYPGPPATPITPVAAATAASWAKDWFDNYNKLPAATNPSGPATVTAQVAYVTSYRQTQGRTVYNGEWGPQSGGPMDSRVRLVTEVRKQCEQAGIGWAIWEDPKNMSLFDSAAGTWVSQIIDALFP